jgi:hypothetical protein
LHGFGFWGVELRADYAFQGNGYATEAAIAPVAHGLRTYIACRGSFPSSMPRNWASQRSPNAWARPRAPILITLGAWTFTADVDTAISLRPCRDDRADLRFAVISSPPAETRRHMATKGLKRFRIAAWLGLVALGIQALIPALVAVEIAVARAEGGDSVFTLCVYGHVHAVSHRGADSHSHDSGDDEDGGTVCPICLALQASPAFTAPAPVVLPLPAVRYLETAVLVARPEPRSVTTAAYRSRAPPSV